MTKESISDKYSEYIIDFGLALSLEHAHKAMDEYAISFGEWLHKNYTQSDITDGWVERAKPLSKNSKTTEQLYSQFIEQQTK